MIGRAYATRVASDTPIAAAVDRRWRAAPDEGPRLQQGRCEGVPSLQPFPGGREAKKFGRSNLISLSLLQCPMPDPANSALPAAPATWHPRQLLRSVNCWVALAIVTAAAIALFPRLDDPRAAHARVSTMLAAARIVQVGVEEYASNAGHWPGSLQEIAPLPPQMRSGLTFELARDGTLTVSNDSAGAVLPGRHIDLSPAVEGGRVNWRCSSPDIAQELLPDTCVHAVHTPR